MNEKVAESSGGSSLATRTRKTPLPILLKSLRQSLRTGVALIVLVFTLLLFFTGHPLAGLFIFLVGTIGACVRRIPDYHRGLVNIFGKRIALAMDEGLGLLPPVGFGIELYDIRKDAESLVY